MTAQVDLVRCDTCDECIAYNLGTRFVIINGSVTNSYCQECFTDSLFDMVVNNEDFHIYHEGKRVYRIL